MGDGHPWTFSNGSGAEEIPIRHDQLFHQMGRSRSTGDYHLSKGETPFKLAFGTETVIPVEISLPTLCMEEFDVDSNSFGLRANLDMLEETRERARVQMANYQQRIVQYYNSQVKEKSFLIGQLVLHQVEVFRLIE
ncbi:uncharacterized protein [Elaeis guineensis]|uniref:uncharacterized protein n=1 Tax=Elaeis guineensis var. tenera TaxID=51953 RepID=UPI003C6D5D6A